MSILYAGTVAMPYGGSASHSRHGSNPESNYNVASIPSPTPKIAYEAPSFRTFQDRKRSRLLAQAEVHQPSRRDQSTVEVCMRATTSPEYSQTAYPVEHMNPTACPSDVEVPHSDLQHPSPIPAQHPVSAILVARSDTLSSIRSSGRCTSPTKRPLPRPPTAVDISKSLERGISDHIPTKHEPPVLIFDSPAIEASNASGSDAMITSGGKQDVSVSPPCIAIVGDAETQLGPESRPLRSTQSSASGQSRMSYSHPPIITVSTLEQTPRIPSKIGTGTVSDRAAIVCAGCDSAIVGRTVNAMSQHFHPECFGCAECGERLEHVSSYEWEGRAFCHLDYHDKFAPRCHHCRTPIVEPRFITLDDQVLGQRFYHELHFFCCECGDPFLHPSDSSSAGAAGAAEETSAFLIHKGHPYCERCHLRLHKPKCKGCRMPIADAALKALGSHWHLECFTCSNCAQPFPNGLYFPVDDHAICRHCFDEV